jgi:hypothetical protein
MAKERIQSVDDRRMAAAPMNTGKDEKPEEETEGSGEGSEEEGSDDEGSEEEEKLEPKKLPKRGTRGQRCLDCGVHFCRWSLRSTCCRVRNASIY